MKQKLPYDRYQRQIILKGFGVAAQDKLKNARVLVIGAGGLGCPIIQYLVAAGVGHIGIADHDTVSLSNLHRQVLYSTEDIGQFKVEVVKQKMMALNPEVDMRIWKTQWLNQHCADHFSEYDVIVDATDNFASRYMINDAAVLFGKPLVFGAVSQYDGQVAVFNQLMQDGNRSVNYRNLFPEPPKDGEVLSCSEAGVLGVLPGVVGAVQASEVIKLLTGIGNPLVNKLWNYNSLNQEVFVVDLTPQMYPQYHAPLNLEQFLQTQYEVICGAPLSAIQEIEPLHWKQNHLTDLLVDIREPYEQPRLNALAKSLDLNFMEIPLSELETKASSLRSRNIVLVCQAGRRSLQGASILMKLNPDFHVCSLQGGVNALVELKMIGDD